MTRIIAVFPGVGKTTFFNDFNENYKIVDSDSSKFKTNFPHDYIAHLQIVLEFDKPDFVLISSHKEVREQLKKYNINYTLVYPEHSLKYEYIRRYIKRGSPLAFIDKIHDNWDLYLDEIEGENFPDKIILSDGEFLVDWIPYLWFKK